ncbi:MAG: DUF397 domain-containing protein [Streptosporangiales bacterium]|nr:DUF397 domain-containing protein [Streptosporangiales bacterium]
MCESQSAAEPYNGMPAGCLTGVVWRRGASVSPGGDGVDLAVLPGGGVALRNAADPDGPALVYTRDEWRALVLGAKDGEFDHLLN